VTQGFRYDVLRDEPARDHPRRPGHGIVWVKAALTYLTPLIVSNYGVVCATRRTDNAKTIAADNQSDSPVMEEVSS
jgi:hypothetical protein